MIRVATWTADIIKVDKEYKKKYILLDQELQSKWIINNNKFSSLWDFYNFWKKNWLITYESRTRYIRALYVPIQDNLSKSSDNKVNNHK